MRSIFRSARCFAIASVMTLAGCGGNQSPLDPAGVQAERISGVWWLYFWITAAVYLAVIVVMFLAVLIGMRRAAPTVPLTVSESDPHERRRARVIIGLLIATAAVLFLLMVQDFRSGRAIASLGGGTDAIRKIRVTGHQWWWEVEYVEAQPHLTV